MLWQIFQCFPDLVQFQKWLFFLNHNSLQREYQLCILIFFKRDKILVVEFVNNTRDSAAISNMPIVSAFQTKDVEQTETFLYAQFYELWSWTFYMSGAYLLKNSSQFCTWCLTGSITILMGVSNVLFLFSHSDMAILHPLNFSIIHDNRAHMTLFFSKLVWTDFSKPEILQSS